MTDKKVRCMRCNGRKKLFKVAGAYSHIDTGGIEVKCPMCLGDGMIVPFESVTKCNHVNEHKKTTKRARKESENG